MSPIECNYEIYNKEILAIIKYGPFLLNSGLGSYQCGCAGHNGVRHWPGSSKGAQQPGGEPPDNGQGAACQVFAKLPPVASDIAQHHGGVV